MVEIVKNKKHLIIKRDGRIQNYDKAKLYNVVLWACDGSTIFADKLIDAIHIKIHNKIHITKLYDEVINTASNLISGIAPFWDTVARNLYLLKIHKELGVKRTKYPYYSDLIIRNVEADLYRKEFTDVDSIATFLNDKGAYKKLDTAIDSSYDKLFSFGGLNIFVQKYCNKHKGKLLELPQHVYMRVAIQLMYKEGIDTIIKKYHQLASHSVTEATPKMVNSLKPNSALFSCCLARPSDSLEGINESITMLAKESKYSGGDAWDVSLIRASGARVYGNNGMSSGCKPYIKSLQENISGYNQGGTRSSACVVTFDAFHYESPEIAEMKLETGKDENRARKLQYSVKWRKKLTEAIIKDEPIYLIDPHKTQDLFESYGAEWNTKYDKYIANTRIHKRKYSARDLAHTFVKTSIETGNLYYTFIDNINNQDIGGEYVPASNLCTEICMAYKPIKQVSKKLVGNKSQFTFEGEIALCNLASVNVVHFMSLTDIGKEQFIYLLVKSTDNAIDTSFYINPLGEKHSKHYRNLGIGIANYANYLASNKCLWDSEKARELTHTLMEDMSYYAIKASIELAKEKSRCESFNKTLWSKGLFPHELSILGASNSNLNYTLHRDWETLRIDLLKYGIRNTKLLAIAPTATSSKVTNSTEGVDPIKQFKTVQEGTYSLPFVVPNLKENRDYYTTLFNIANKDKIELAAIRQKFLCMSQPMSLAYKKAKSTYEVIRDIIYAEQLGLKSLYYTHTQKAETEVVCESCSS